MAALSSSFLSTRMKEYVQKKKNVKNYIPMDFTAACYLGVLLLIPKQKGVYQRLMKNSKLPEKQDPGA